MGSNALEKLRNNIIATRFFFPRTPRICRIVKSELMCENCIQGISYVKPYWYLQIIYITEDS